MSEGSERAIMVAVVTQADRKRAARRTALLLACVAIGIYVAFIVSGILKSR
jgi:hypothetical protein